MDAEITIKDTKTTKYNAVCAPHCKLWTYSAEK